MSAPDPQPTEHRLVIPFDIEGVIVDVIKRLHPQHLAKMERARELAPRTFEQLKTVVRMADSAGLRLGGDTVPACLVGVIGAPEFVRNEDNGIDAVYQLGMQVTAMGQRRRDVILRRDIYAWTVAELMYQRLPRGSGGLINSVRMTDYEPIAESETQRTLGDARMVWEVGVPNVLSITGFLPADHREWPTEAGGPPEEPYDPIEPRPTATPSFTIEKTPLVE